MARCCFLAIIVKPLASTEVQARITLACGKWSLRTVAIAIAVIALVPFFGLHSCGIAMAFSKLHQQSTSQTKMELLAAQAWQVRGGHGGR